MTGCGVCRRWNCQWSIRDRLCTRGLTGCTCLSSWKTNECTWCYQVKGTLNMLGLSFRRVGKVDPSVEAPVDLPNARGWLEKAENRATGSDFEVDVHRLVLALRWVLAFRGYATIPASVFERIERGDV